MRSEREKRKPTLEERVRRIREAFDETGFRRACVGISGGKDSAVVAALLVRALGAENVTAAIVPCGMMPDMRDAKAVCQALGLTPVVISIGMPMAGLQTDVMNELHVPLDKDIHEAHVNATSRMRTCVLRYVAAMSDALLVGTTNASEWHVGYFTKGGDDAVDLEPILDLTCHEVVEMGRAMPEVPRAVLEKAPADGLSGRTDEERLGVSYKAIDDVLDFGTSGDEETDKRILELHRTTEHKRHLPRAL